MPRSQNGYSANDRSVIQTYTIKGVKHTGKVGLRRGDVATVLLYVLQRYDKEVQALHWPGVWGYAERLIRGSSTTLSNHASGTATDADADDHPLGTDPRSNYTKAQIAAIHRIINFCDGVVRWGGDYTGRKDGMHFEINASPARVKALVAKIKGYNTQPVVSAYRRPVQKFQAILEYVPAMRTGGWGPGTDTRALHMRQAALHTKGDLHGMQKSTVKFVQRIVDVHPDGYWGPKSRAGMERWVKSFQSIVGVKQDGDWGPKTEAAFQAFRKEHYHPTK